MKVANVTQANALINRLQALNALTDGLKSGASLTITLDSSSPVSLNTNKEFTEHLRKLLLDDVDRQIVEINERLIALGVEE